MLMHLLKLDVKLFKSYLKITLGIRCEMSRNVY